MFSGPFLFEKREVHRESMYQLILINEFQRIYNRTNLHDIFKKFVYSCGKIHPNELFLIKNKQEINRIAARNLSKVLITVISS